MADRALRKDGTFSQPCSRLRGWGNFAPFLPHGPLPLFCERVVGGFVMGDEAPLSGTPGARSPSSDEHAEPG